MARNKYMDIHMSEVTPKLPQEEHLAQKTVGATRDVWNFPRPNLTMSTHTHKHIHMDDLRKLMQPSV